jgi:hypothetical protein
MTGVATNLAELVCIERAFPLAMQTSSSGGWG